MRMNCFNKPFSGFISVIVSTYNWPQALDLVLEALLKQNDSSFEIIIADDGSKADTKSLIEHFQKNSAIKITHVWQPDCGFRAAENRNRGIAAANGEYLIFLDGDSIPQYDFVKQHRRLAQANYFISGSRILMGPTLTQLFIDKKLAFPGVNNKFCNKIFWVRQRLLRGINKVIPLFLKSFYIPRFSIKSSSLNRVRSCNLAVWAHDCRKVDGFDAVYTGWGYEDSDFALRLYNVGIKRKFGHCATEIFHLYHPSNPAPNLESNANRVLQRIQSKHIQAEKGISKLEPVD